MDYDSWLDNIEKLAFNSELSRLEKLADSPMYSEEKIPEDEYNAEELPSDNEEDGYVYHSNDGIMMRNNMDAKKKIDQLRNKVKSKRSKI